MLGYTGEKSWQNFNCGYYEKLVFITRVYPSNLFSIYKCMWSYAVEETEHPAGN